MKHKKLRTTIAIILLFTIVITFLLSSCKKKEDESLSAVITYNLESEPMTLDPQIATDIDSRTVIRNIFEGLTRLNKDMQVEPAIAKSWTSNNDFTEYTFNLRDDCKWSDKEGTTVCADDFVFAFRRLVDPNTQSKLASTVFCIKNAQQINSSQKPVSELGVEQIDSKTLKIKLDYSNKDLPKLLSTTPCMPCNEKFFNDSNGQYGLECDKIICNGFFKFTNKYSWDHKKTISLSRNAGHGKDNTSIPAGVTFSIGTYSEEKTIPLEEFDVISVTDDIFDKVKKAGMKLTDFEDTTLGLCFNMDDTLMQNDNIRKGLLGAFNRDNMVKNIPEGFVRAEDPVVPSINVVSSNYRQLAGTGVSQVNISNAAEMIANGLKEVSKDSLSSVSILCANTPTARLLASNTIETLNNNLGIFFNIEPVSSDELENRISVADYKIALVPIRADSDGPVKFLSKFKSDNKNNVAGLKNLDYDTILAKAEKASGTGCVEYCVQAEKFLVENAIFYPLCYQKTYFAEDTDVTGAIFYPYNEGIDFSHVVKKS